MRQAAVLREAPEVGPARDRRILERVLLGLPAIAGAARAEVAELVAHASLIEVRRGALVVRRAERLPGMMVVASGSAKVSLRRPGGEERVLRLLGPGDMFGLAVAVLDRPSPVEVRALSASLLAIVPPLSLHRLMERDAAFARGAVRLLAGKFLDLVSELESSAHCSALQRLAAYLGSIARRAEAGGGWLARLPATKTTVAARLGIQKETLSRLLRALAARELIDVRGREILLLDPDRLAALAEDGP